VTGLRFLTVWGRSDPTGSADWPPAMAGRVCVCV